MNRDSSGWGKAEGLDLYWTQEEIGLTETRKWNAAHGMVWSNKPRPGRLLAAIYVRDSTYAISTFGLGGLEPKQLKSLENHLEQAFNLKKRDTRHGGY